MSQLRVWIVFGLLCVTWGSSYLFIRIGVHEITPVALVALRLTIGAVTVGVIAGIRRQNVVLSSRQLGTIALAGVLNCSIPFLLISWGETTVPSGLASVLNSTTPIFTVLMAGALLQEEPITVQRLAGVLIGFVGVVVLVGHDLQGATVQWSRLTGETAIVLASFCYGAAYVFIHRTLRGVPSMTITLYILVVSAIQTLAVSLIFSPPPIFTMSAKAWLAVLWLGMLGSGFAFLCAYLVLEHWGPSRYSLVTYVLPAIGLTLGAIFLGEVIDWHVIAGSVLVVFGIVVVSLASGHRGSSRRAAREGADAAGLGARSASGSSARDQ